MAREGGAPAGGHRSGPAWGQQGPQGCCLIAFSWAWCEAEGRRAAEEMNRIEASGRPAGKWAPIGRPPSPADATSREARDSELICPTASASSFFSSSSPPSASRAPCPPLFVPPFSRYAFRISKLITLDAHQLLMHPVTPLRLRAVGPLRVYLGQGSYPQGASC